MTKKVRQLLADFFNDANNLVNIPKEHSMLSYFGITLICRKIRTYFAKGHYIMSKSKRVRRRFNFKIWANRVLHVGVTQTMPFCCIPDHKQGSATAWAGPADGTGTRKWHDVLLRWLCPDTDSGMPSFFLKSLRASAGHASSSHCHLLCPFDLDEPKPEFREVTNGHKEFIILLGSLTCKKNH